MRTKTIIALFAMFAITFANIANAQKYKVVSSNLPSPPVWINGTEQNCIIVSSIATNIEDARTECLNKIKTHIIESIAENIEFSSIEVNEQTSTIDKIEMQSLFKSELTKNAASIPYIKGVSISKALESYWEERKDKKTSQRSFLLAIKYPFSRQEMNKLISEFEKQDMQMWNEYKSLKNKIDSISNFDEIEKSIRSLQTIKEYLFDNVRKSQVENLQKDYHSLYDRIAIITTSEELGKAEIKCYLSGREIEYNKMPKIVSETATEITYKTLGGVSTLTYSYEGCPDDVTGEIKIYYDLNIKKVEHNIYFTPSQAKTKFNVVDVVYISATISHDNTLSDLQCKLKLSTQGYAPFTVKSLELRIPALQVPLLINDLNNKIETDGDAELCVEAAYPIVAKYSRDNLLDILHGEIMYEKGGVSATKKITLPYKILLTN